MLTSWLCRCEVPWGKDGLWIVSDAFGTGAYHLNVKLSCQCGHFVCYEGHCFWWLLERTGKLWHFSDIKRRYYCGPCFKRTGRKIRPRVEGVKDPVTVELPWPSELDWKRAKRRVR